KEYRVLIAADPRACIHLKSTLGKLFAKHIRFDRFDANIQPDIYERALNYLCVLIYRSVSGAVFENDRFVLITRFFYQFACLVRVEGVFRSRAVRPRLRRQDRMSDLRLTEETFVNDLLPVDGVSDRLT